MPTPGHVTRWTEIGWGIYLWLSIILFIFACLSVITREDELYDILYKASNDKILLSTLGHLVLIIVVAVVYHFLKISLGDIRETEREVLVDKCRALLVDWIIFLVFARPLYQGRPASVPRLASEFLFLFSMRIIHVLLKQRTSAMGDFRPNAISMVRVITASALICYINYAVVSSCMAFLEIKAANDTISSAVPFIESCQIVVRYAADAFFDGHLYREFVANHIHPDISTWAMLYNNTFGRMFFLWGYWHLNLVKLLCPLWFIRLVRMLSDYQYGAVSWLAFESLQLCLESAFTTLKGFMHLFDYELQSKTHRTWRDLTIVNIVTDLIQELITSALSIMWIVMLLYTGTTRSVFGIPIFLLTDMVQNVGGCYTTILSLYRYVAMETFLAQFPAATIDEIERQDTCIVCRDTLYINSGDPVKLHCSHVFHYSCLKNWYTQQQNCPICRSSINSSSTAPQTQPTPTVNHRESATDRVGQTNNATTSDAPTAYPTSVNTERNDHRPEFAVWEALKWKELQTVENPEVENLRHDIQESWRREIVLKGRLKEVLERIANQMQEQERS